MSEPCVFRSSTNLEIPGVPFLSRSCEFTLKTSHSFHYEQCIQRLAHPLEQRYGESLLHFVRRIKIDTVGKKICIHRLQSNQEEIQGGGESG